MLVNGQQQQFIDIADRAFQYGDGCFTTMAYRNGQIELFGSHIERLKKACNVLTINFDNWSKLQECILESLPIGDCVIKVIISRGVGGRGYSPQGANHANFVISHHVIPNQYSEWQSTGINLTVSSVKLAIQPLLAGIKHLNRLEQIFIKQDLSQMSFDEVIVCDTQQRVVESSAGNVFWLKNEVWYTPDLTASGVEGVMRNHVVAVLNAKRIDCQVISEDLSTLWDAQELFICNSLMSIVPVASLHNPHNNQITYFKSNQVKKLQYDVLKSINNDAMDLK